MSGRGHDPLCDLGGVPDLCGRCELIRKIREDERAHEAHLRRMQARRLVGYSAEATENRP